VALTSRPGLEDRHHGRRYTAATVGRRLVERGPALFAGGRFWPRADAQYLDEHPTVGHSSARELSRGTARFRKLLEALPTAVHLSIDVTVLDPSHLPIAGNVDPGGLDWFALTDAVDAVFAAKSVLSCDVCGLAPRVGDIAPSFTVAQLTLRCFGRAAQHRAG
jgi:agmatinase